MELREVQVTERVPDYRRKKGEDGKPLPIQAVFGSFHRWEEYKDEDSSRVYGIVELKDGSVMKFLPEEIKFIDRQQTPNIFEGGEITPD